MVTLKGSEKHVRNLEVEQRLQTEMGCKFQIAAEPLLEEMGYRIVKAEHRPFEDLGKGGRKYGSYARKLGSYLWDYADYIAMKRGRLFVVDVKSQWYVPLLRGSKGYPLTSATVNFPAMEMAEYPRSKIPVLILLTLYRSGSDITKLGSVFYKLVPFRHFKFSDRFAGGFLDNKFGGCRRLSSRRIYAIMRKTRALDVVEIGPGYLTREKQGRRIREGPYSSGS